MPTLQTYSIGNTEEILQLQNMFPFKSKKHFCILITVTVQVKVSLVVMPIISYLYMVQQYILNSVLITGNEGINAMSLSIVQHKHKLLKLTLTLMFIKNMKRFEKKTQK